jgi:hypothetical protein
MPDKTAFKDLINEKMIELPVNSKITIVWAGDVGILLLLTDRNVCLSAWEELKLE